MDYKRLSLFLLTVFIVLSTVSAISATDSQADTVNETIELDDTTITEDNDVNVASEDTSEDISTVDEKTVKTEDTGTDETIETHKTHIVNSTTVSEIFDFSTSNGYLSDIVSEGDVLDFQGTINLTNQSLTFNKAVNVTSTTGDSLICLNTVAGSLFGESPGSSFVFGEDGSYSNVSNINLLGTQLWVSGASQIVFDNISVVVNGTRVGSGVGVTAVREGSTYITLKNSYFYTKDNGGSTTIALSGANYCTVDNCTVQAEGNVGNLIYLNFYNIDNSYQADWNRNNTITNNHLIGPATPASICWGIVITGAGNFVANNTIDYGGTVITAAYGSEGQIGEDNIIINNTATNTSSSVSVPSNATFTGNSLAGSVIVGANSTVENNTMASITSISGNATIINNNINGSVTATSSSTVYANASLINNTITGDVTLSNNFTVNGNTIYGDVTLGTYSRNTTLNNNIIYGKITLNRSSTNTSLNNNTIYDEITINGTYTDITGNTIIANVIVGARGSDTVIENNQINGTLTIKSSNINVSGNNITSDMYYTIEVMGDNAVISDNYLVGSTLVGDNSVVISSGSGNVVENNLPESSGSVVITDDNYVDYFYDNGTFMGNLANYTTITLSGQFNNKNFTFINGKYTIIGDEAIIYGGVINVTSTAKVTILNVTINNTDSDLTQAVILESSGNIIESSNIYYDGINSFTAITVTGEDNTVTQNNIILNAYAGSVDWTTSLATTYAIGILSSNNMVSSNKITMTDSDNIGAYSTVDGITIQSIGNNTADNNTVYNNTIQINSTGYAYSINLGASASNNNISNNTIKANSTEASYGVQISSVPAVNTTIYGNKINVTSPKVVYGVVLGAWTTGNITANISFNQINGTADQVYLIEVYDYAHDIIIGNNTLRGNGNYTMGIGIANSQDITITNNTISINGTTNGTTTSYDTISPTTAGIYIYNTTNVNINSTTPSLTSTTHKINVTNGVGVYILNSCNVTLYKVGILTNYSSNIQDALVIENSSDITVYNGSIIAKGYVITAQDSVDINIFNMSNNNIATAGYNLTSQESDYAIKVVNTTNIEVYYNRICGATTSGNSAVEVIDCTNAEIYNNIPFESTIELDTTDLALNQTGTIYINILTDIGETRANGTATVTIEDTPYSVTITNGVGSFTYTPTTTDPIDITVTFKSNDVRIADDATLTTQIELENIVDLSIDEATISGNTVTITANIERYGLPVDEGYITIKVNGVTLRDDEGNVITVDVVDGVATYEYTLPSVSSDRDYEISAVYAGSTVIKSDVLIVTVTPSTANIAISTEGTLTAGNTVTFTATITDSSGNAVTNGKVVFKLNGKTLCDADGNVIYGYVDANGVASIEYTIPDNYSAKDYVLTAVFTGSGFERSEANTTITLTKTNTKITASDITINKGDNTQLTATITDEEGNLVNGTTKVAIKINGKTFTQVKVVDGVIDLTLYTSSFTNPTYTITIIVGENTYYNKAEASLTLTVVE